MKIVIANKYLYPRGGDCIYTLRLMKLLQENGHTVIPFSMRHPRNIQTEYDEYFTEFIDFHEESKNISIKSALKVASRSVINLNAARSFERLIADTRPDVIHLQNIHHQLTPAILGAPVKYGIPVVWTQHDSNLLCPDHLFLRNGKPCTSCGEGKYYNAVRYRCKKNSFGASLLAALECSIHNPTRLARHVYKFIYPSEFTARFMLDLYGMDPEKVEVIPHFLPYEEIGSTARAYFFYFGRLSAEKGIETLLKAFKKLGGSRLVIAGDGPDRGYYESMAHSMGLSNVEFIGYQPPESIKILLGGCIASILPSKCYESFGFTTLETMSAGKPVIASRIGALPEQIKDNDNGLFFEPGDHDRLAVLMNKLLIDPAFAEKLGENGRKTVKEEYSPQKHYQKLLNLYLNAINSKSPKKKLDISIRMINSIKRKHTTGGIEV
ncbi:MAG: glycosyltransferase [candidate division Zixibacteria bacterium]|nr:glycosyltransferase [candidate division Zixibacteria bacterium]